MSDIEYTRRDLLKAGLGAAAAATLPRALRAQSSGRSPAAPEEAPNVVYIMADQLRACSVGCYGNDEISTPNLDALAAGGARMVNAVSTSPLCTPHRACLMTGRYPTATGVMLNGTKLPQSEVGIAQVYGQAGYQTNYIGKWHLNGPTPVPRADPGWVSPEDRQGFQRWLAFNVGHFYYDGQYYLNNDPTLRSVPEGLYEPDFQASRAIRFIQSNQDRPFFLCVSIGTPHKGLGRQSDLPPGGAYHFPYEPDSLTLRPNVDYPDTDYARTEYADYYGIVSNFDWNVGRIMSALVALGLDQKTIVVVSSDHGDVLGSHYDELGVFRFKGKMYAESLNVPFILRYPQTIAPMTIPDLFTSVDIMPTLLGLCGLPVPAAVMGRDFAPLLTGTGAPVEPPNGPIPSAESALVGMFGFDWVGVRTTEYSLECRRYDLQPRRLHHNSVDPYQLANLVDDPAYESTKNALHAELLAWMDYVEPSA